MILFFILYVIALLAFAIHLSQLPKQERTKAKVIELLLLYQLVFSLGATSLLAFIGLNFLPNTVQSFMEWTPCPYQQELANVNLAFGVLGILCIWLRGLFWVATVLGFSIWIFGDALHHLYLVLIKNQPLSNKLLLISTDAFVPIVLCVLLWLYIKTQNSQN